MSTLKRPTLDDYYKDIHLYDPLLTENESIFNYEHCMDMMKEASLIIDFQNRNFKEVIAKGFFLCGYSIETLKSMGYEFFNEIIHQEDISLWAEIHNAILKYLHKEDLSEEEVLYFTCTFRIKSSLG